MPGPASANKSTKAGGLEMGWLSLNICRRFAQVLVKCPGHGPLPPCSAGCTGPRCSESPGNGGHGWPGRLSRQVQHLACQDVALYLVGAAVDHGAAGVEQRRQRVECLAVEFLVAGYCALLLAGLDQQGADAVIGFAGPDFEQRD